MTQETVHVLDPCCGSRMMWFDPEKPLFGQVSGRGGLTHWLVFMKPC